MWRVWHLAVAILFALILGGDQDCTCTAFVPTTTTRPTTTTTTTKKSSFELHLFRSWLPPPQSTDNNKHGTPHSGVFNGQVNGHININNNVHGRRSKVPFVIERLGVRPREQVFKDIAEMCISVFFNDGKSGRALPPWKEVQLSYLRMIQMNDLRRRRARDQTTNAMFVAYRVEEASPNAALSQPLILNLRNVHNLASLDTATISSLSSSGEQIDLVRGEILGFCEVSMVPFGLVPAISVSSSSVSNSPMAYTSPLDNNNNNIFDNGDENDDDNDTINSKRMIPRQMRNVNVARPVLTNLSVKKNARVSGVGSKLLEACERTARAEWGKSEMVLEVENDNVAAQKWYQKRGYRVLFSDPSSQRYDVNGFFLKKVGCTRQILRKPLNTFRAPQLVSTTSNNNDTNNNNINKSPLLDTFGGVLRRLRENVLQTSS